MPEEPNRTTETRRTRWAVGVVVAAVSAGLFAGCMPDLSARSTAERKNGGSPQNPASSAPDADAGIVDAPSPIAPADRAGEREGSKSGKGQADAEDSSKRGPQSKTPRSTSAAAGDPAGWVTSWRDDFTKLDSSRWNVRERGQSPNQEALFLAKNAWVRDGLLRIQAKKESVDRWDYTSGYVDTNGKVALPNYFRLEVRARVPWGKGLWPAPLWLRPSDASGGEIDVVETFGRTLPEPTTHHSLHSSYGASHQQLVRLKKFEDLGSNPWGWHTYRVEKTPGLIRMWVDDTLAATFSSGDPSWFDRYYEANKKWNLRVNFNVGGRWNGMPDRTTNWSGAQMKVDYIHAWVRR
jgi:beta-glucanase (GH16 family)